MLPLHEGIVYCPAHSRRLGMSLGVNILPRHQKACTFNCSYCQYGWTEQACGTAAAAYGWPEPEMIARAVASALDQVARHGNGIAQLTLAGHGEPTLHPHFANVVDALVRTRDARTPRIRLAILSNSSTLGDPAVRRALGRLDGRYMKLDAGEADLFRRINSPSVTFERVLDGLRRLPNIVIQAIFVRDRLGRMDNATDLAVSTWIAALSTLHPAGVHIYTIDRAPAWPYLQAVPLDRLNEIARRAEAAGLQAHVFGATRATPATPAQTRRGETRGANYNGQRAKYH
jgi:wyosine [tRNA(Phe)-imidazoG37] synthetase (radical SAM superfamily)